MRERGITEEEVMETIEPADLVEVVESRYIRRRVFTTGFHWRGRYYPHKEVIVVYAPEDSDIIVVTAIARYGRWEEAL